MITKLFLLIANLLAQLYGFTPPNPRPPVDQLHEQHGAERLVPWAIPSTRVFLWTWALFEAGVLVTLSGHCPPALADSVLHLLPRSLTDNPPCSVLSLMALTPAYLAGTALTVLGAALRGACYRTLGAHFTFELSVPASSSPAHGHGQGQGLVTDGPLYGVVRHPSYAGLVVLAVGWFMCALDPRGVGVSVCVVAAAALSAGAGSAPEFRGDAGHGHRCGEAVPVTVTAALAWAWATALATLLVGIHQRMDREDTMLERHFGETWRAWAKKVPYRLVPGVY